MPTTPPTITASPTPPDPTDRGTYNSRAYAWMQWLKDAVTQIYNVAVNAYNNAVEAAASAVSAAGSSASAVAAANFKGDWSALTGALNMPASVSHGGDVWLLLSNLANVAAATPGVSGAWLKINGTLTNPVINGFTGNTAAIDIGSGQFAKDTSGNISIGAGSLLVKNLNGLGYGIGAGGTAVQPTSKSTNITLNKLFGKITTPADALGGGSIALFLVTNSTYNTATDLVAIQIIGTVNYQAWSSQVSGTGFYIAIKNISAGWLSESLEIRFLVLKGALS